MATNNTRDTFREELLSQTSIERVMELAKSSLGHTMAFKEHKVAILQKHIAPEAWHDAVACVDRRLQMGTAARRAFEEDYRNGTVADAPDVEPLSVHPSDKVEAADPNPDEADTPDPDRTHTDQTNNHVTDKHETDFDESTPFPFNIQPDPPTSPPTTTTPPRRPSPTARGNWDPYSLATLTQTIDRLLTHIGRSGWRHPNLADWESSWEESPATHRDDGTERPLNFTGVFARRVHLSSTGVQHEGVPLDAATRPRLQRAFFRLELLRRHSYSRPLCPRGARWQTLRASFRHGEPQAPAGECPETRLRRAETLFRGWAREDFVEVTCAFKATLHIYAVPTHGMLSSFADAATTAAAVAAAAAAATTTTTTNSDGPTEAGRVRECLWDQANDLRIDRGAVGTQWETDPLSGEADYPLFGIGSDAEYVALRELLRDRRADIRAFRKRRLVYLSRAEWDDLRCTIFRPKEVRHAWGHRRGALAEEAHPEAEMGKFFHVLCSLPLGFLSEFMDMSARRKQRFLKSAYWAISRIKACRAPAFLSGEMGAWSSVPGNWDYDAAAGGRRVFPSLSVRAVVLACLSNIYRFARQPGGGGYEVLADETGRCVWLWDTATLTPRDWMRFRVTMAYRPFNIDRVLRMSDGGWQGAWRDDAQFERLLWTGPGMDKPRWEGYGHAGRLDPGECYCHVGEGCPICVRLPQAEDPEWELVTAEERGRVLQEEEEMMRNPELLDRDPDLREAVEGYWEKTIGDALILI